MMTTRCRDRIYGVAGGKKTAATLLLVTAACGNFGCSRWNLSVSHTSVAPGVVLVRDSKLGIQLLDIDLSVATVQPIVVATHIERRGNNFVGDAKSVHDWAEQYKAVGGINGGYFGDVYDKAGTRKQIVGLAVVDNTVVAPGARTASTRTPGEKFIRSAVGFGPSGRPDISWATGTTKAGIRRYKEPLDTGAGFPWKIRWSVACGPRLFVRGDRRITDKEERLVSPGNLPRTFIAYDLSGGKPHHLILGCASAMEYAQVADAITSHFRREHRTRPHDGICMDGGGSSQLVYRQNNTTLTDAMPARTTVPTAILLVPTDSISKTAVSSKAN